jgi:large subunit ribosomal protein L9
MKVLLLEDISKLGRKNEIVEVSDGFAKNFLIPHKKAIIATAKIIAQYQQKKQKEAALNQQKEKEINALAEKLSSWVFKFSVKVGKNNEVFSSVHDSEIREKIFEFLKNNKVTALGIDDIKFTSKPIKELGLKEITVKIGKGDLGREVKVKIEVVPSSN